MKMYLMILFSWTLSRKKQNKTGCGLMIEKSFKQQAKTMRGNSGSMRTPTCIGFASSCVCLSVFSSYSFLFPARASRNRKEWSEQPFTHTPRGVPILRVPCSDLESTNETPQQLELSQLQLVKTAKPRLSSEEKKKRSCVSLCDDFFSPYMTLRLIALFICPFVCGGPSVPPTRS